jgi:hypothetical protein
MGELVLQLLWNWETRSIKKKRTYFFYHGLCTFQLCCAARRWGDCFIPKLETMTNGQLNGVFLFWRTLKRDTGKVLLNRND